MNNAKLFLISDDEIMIEQLKIYLKQSNIVIDQIIDLETCFEEDLTNCEPAVILLAGADKEATKKVCKVISKSNNRWALIILLKKVDLGTVKEAMRNGVHDVLTIPDEMNKLEATLCEAAKSIVNYNRSPENPGDGQLLAVYSAKGGSGKTFIAVHLAIALKSIGKKVLIIDFNLQFGGVQNFLDIQEKRNLSDLSPVIDELNLNHIKNVVTNFGEEGPDVLLGPANPEIAETINDEHINSVLSKVKQFYDLIVLDLPSDLNMVSLSALNTVDQVLYVVNPDSPSLYAMKAAFDIFDRYRLKENKRVSLVINRVSSKNDINIEDIAMLSQYPVIGHLRSDFSGIQTFINLGRPLFNSSRDKNITKLAKDILMLAEQVI